MDVFSEERFNVHRQILNRKNMIREVFVEFHRQMFAFANQYLNVGKPEIELGAGVFPLKNTRSQVLATDIISAAHLDRTLDAQNLELPDNSVSVIYGQNCFHHFPQPELFFKEATRVLIPRGGFILIEPHFGFFANIIYKRLFAQEGYDKSSPNWNYLKNDLPNQAVSFLTFVRDRKRFESLFPELEIVKIYPSPNWMRYLLSGGLNFKQLVPNFAIPIIKVGEWLLKPLAGALALHCYFVVRKKG